MPSELPWNAFCLGLYLIHAPAAAPYPLSHRLTLRHSSAALLWGLCGLTQDRYRSSLHLKNLEAVNFSLFIIWADWLLGFTHSYRSLVSPKHRQRVVKTTENSGKWQSQ